MSITAVKAQNRIELHCGKLIDVKNQKVLEEVTVGIEGSEILYVNRGYSEAREGVEIIDLTNHTVSPGWMDMHIHIESQSGPKSYEEGFRLNEADFALRATVYAKRTLLAGFTTVRDLGGSGVNVSLRRAIDAGYVDGPRIYTAEKAIATTGGHADPTNGLNKELMGNPGPDEGVGNGPEALTKAVRQRYKNGADVIKITATGGVLSVAKDGSGPQFTMEELHAIRKTADDYSYRIAAHAHGVEGMKRAVLAGINSIEHGTLMNDEIMDLMIEKGTYLVPTMMAGEFVMNKAKIKGYFPPVIVPKALEIGPKIQETFSKAHKKGVKIAFGTDSGVSAHGDNAREFELMVQAGMSPMQAIISATKTASELLGASDELGQVAKGFQADIVAVEGDLMEDISRVHQVRFVMKAGKIYKID